jgi:hypothetical protein
VTINGEYLDGVVKILVDANPTALTFSATKTTLTFVAPRHAAGKAQLVVYSATGARYVIPLMYSTSVAFTPASFQYEHPNVYSYIYQYPYVNGYAHEHAYKYGYQNEHSHAYKHQNEYGHAYSLEV